MSEEHRYDDDEVQEIFGLASDASAGRPVRPSGDGLTLTELQRIGEQVGLLPERVAAAARRLELRRDAVRARTYLGLPLAVGISEELPRALTDTEWEVLVGEIRETFHAAGRVTVVGGLRDWSNGNLHVSLEATESGHRIRLHTTKGTAQDATWMGVTLIALAVLLLGAFLVTGQLADDLFVPIFLGTLGAAALGSNALILPAWARERQRQMEHIALRALELTGSAAEG